jgi:uncharacterized protein
MPFYAAPGIYVEEVPSGARPIGAVGTSTAGFIGTAPDADARQGEAVAVNNWTEFTRIFASNDEPQGTPLSRAVWGFFSNGGGRCFIVNVAEGEPIEGGGQRRSGLQLLEAVDEVAIVAAPGYTGVQNYEALLTHCERMEDRVAILDTPDDIADISRLTEVGTLSSSGGSSSSRRSGGSSSSERTPAEGEEASGSASTSGGGGSSGGGGQGPPPTGGVRPRESAYAALYFPWIVTFDPLSRQLVDTPPSGHIAGVWARVDTQRGVHKAPANEPLNGALDLKYLVTRQEQEVLNPMGVNCIRNFGSEGIKVWGARTLAGDADPFRYLNVRRLFNMLKESIAEGTRWIVFEPNDTTLWTSIRGEIGNFLTRVWRDGALFGRTPEEAFYVKCDAETNPAEERDAGRVTALIGVAPVKPAEFVVFKLSQWVGGVQTESVGG